jgi:hypothetical protein
MCNDPASRPILIGRVITKKERGLHLLSAEDGCIALNEPAARILKLCNGLNDRARIVRLLNRARDMNIPAHLIHEFLDAAAQRKWVIPNRASQAHWLIVAETEHTPGCAPLA